jgi:hypothetical protein
MLRICNICSVEKDLKEFHKNKKCSLGYLPTCKTCIRIKDQARYPKEKEQRLINNHKYYRENKERVTSYIYSWIKDNPDKVKEYKQAWKLRNPDKVNAAVSKRRAKRLNATPIWADEKKIEGFYKEAKELEKKTGIKYHVDHIIPLISDRVCGLHVEYNLQVLPYYENIAKSNKLLENV